jgi:hypothetical protein
MNPNDDTVLARFAGGDMNVAEEAEFLACCEAEPELWRRAALAMVEHRQLASMLRQFADGQRAEPLEKRESAKGRPKARWLTRAVMAAGLFFVLVGGMSLTYWAGRHQTSDVRQVRPAPTTGPPETAAPYVFVLLQPPGGPHLGDSEHVPRPMADTDLLAARLAEMHTKSAFPIEARSLLREVGFEVEEKSTLYISSGANGQPVAIPTRDILLRYVNQQN